MTKNFYKIAFLLTFLAGFFAFIFNVIASKENNFNKSSLEFDKSFSGVTQVIDGDSIKVGDKEVRLFGLDAPEYKQICFDEKDQEYACGQVSRNFVVNLIEGKEVICYYAQKDKYDRYLGKCEIAKVSINQEIVKNGMAIIYSYSASDEAMDDLESKARNSKVGIWRGKFQNPKDYRKEHPRKN